MGKLVLALCALLLPACVLAGGTDVQKPTVSISPSVVTKSGEPRVFWGPNGRTVWAPSLPVYHGDTLTMAFSISDDSQPSRVSVLLDNRPLADVRKPPWKVVLDTARIPPGEHTIKADVRFTGESMMYGIIDFKFFVQKPREEVKGVVEEIGSANDDSTLLPVQPLTPREFNPPSDTVIDKNFTVVPKSTNIDAARALQTGQPVVVRYPVKFYLEPGPGVDRWAYSIIRDGKQVAGSGPLSRLTYLEVAPETADEPGLLPGEVLLRAWGVKSNGRYSLPVDIPLVIK